MVFIGYPSRALSRQLAVRAWSLGDESGLGIYNGQLLERRCNKDLRPGEFAKRVKVEEDLLEEVEGFIALRAYIGEQQELEETGNFYFSLSATRNLGRLLGSMP